MSEKSRGQQEYSGWTVGCTSELLIASLNEMFSYEPDSSLDRNASVVRVTDEQETPCKAKPVA
jgi:hypothetical protein